VSPDEFSTLPAEGMIDPDRLRFSQDSVMASFQDPDVPFETIGELTDALLTGEQEPGAVVPVQITVKDGKVFSIDNRRLKAFQDAGVDIPFEKVDFADLTARTKRTRFTSENDGISIEVREVQQ
jgi:hypothetical protein